MAPAATKEMGKGTQKPCQSDHPRLGDRLVLKWLEGEPTQSQKQLTGAKLQELLHEASRLHHASGNAITKLCYFIEQCKISQSPHIRDVIFSKESCLGLFNLYIEWSEKTQVRSMRQVLDLVSLLIAHNPEKLVSKDVKALILQRILPIIGHQDTQTLVKPAFRSLDSFLSKHTISPEELLAADEAINSLNIQTQPLFETSWDSFVFRIFYWLGRADVSPAAGKCLVTLFKGLRMTSASNQRAITSHTGMWQYWIRTGLSRDPRILENVKNYLLPPLFKNDRPGSLAFLQELNQQTPIAGVQNQEVDAHALLHVASMEVGKKAGLVEEQSLIQFQKAFSKKSGPTITMNESAVGSLLDNSSDTVRSLAFSVLVSSSSPLRPFSPTVLDLLPVHMALLHSDVDAKFRNEILSSNKQLVERLRGSTAFLTRELSQLLFKLNAEDNKRPDLPEAQAIHDATNELLLKHQKFIEWYIEFCLAELIPTASYQRHITALKTISLFLHSRIDVSVLSQVPPNSTSWPFTLQFFTPRSMRLLLDLLVDPFEDVRSGATEILRLALPIHFSEGSSYGPLENMVTSDSHRDETNNKDCDMQEESDGTCQNTALDLRPLGLLMDFVTRAREASKRTGRADYADGVARSLKILYGLQPSAEACMKLLEDLVNDLESKVVVAERDLAQAVFEAPVHGDFATLNLICDLVGPSLENSKTDKNMVPFWTQWSGLQLRMVALSARIWSAVKAILCNDAPEGYLPQDLDDHDSVDTKDVLSYSFRAIHESSNLMRSVATTLKRRCPDELTAATHEVFAQIGHLTFEQLSTLRHRGAFSTVSLTFSYCCQLTQHTSLLEHSTLTEYVSESPLTPVTKLSLENKSILVNELNQASKPPLGIYLLRDWWRGTIACIHNQASTTRRSAGIPALVTGIMSANSQHLPIGEVMGTLKEEARKPVDLSIPGLFDLGQLPQVHALNSLKEIFKTSSIREVIDDHVADCIQIAAEALASTIWPIRNCGLLLFQSLSNFLIGGENSVPTSVGQNPRVTRIQFSKYPNLVRHLMQFLEKSPVEDEQLTTTVKESLELIFPALDLIRTAGPPEEYFESIYNNVLGYLDSKVWQVRELAASTICRLTAAGSWISTIQELIQMSGGSANKRHGALLAINIILERQLALADYSVEDIPSIVMIFDQEFGQDALHEVSYIRAPIILAAHIKAGNLLLKTTIEARYICSRNESVGGSTKRMLQANGYDAMQQLLREYTAIAGEPPKVVLNQFVRRGVYLSAIQDDLTVLVPILERALQLGVTLAALEAIDDAWKYHQTQEQLVGLTKAYISVICLTGSPAIRSTALTVMEKTLSGILDLKMGGVYRAIIVLFDRVLCRGPKSPQLETAQSKITGLLISAVLLSNEDSEGKKKAVSNWGFSVHKLSADHMGVTRRLAAAKALSSFYLRPEYRGLIGDDCLLPSIWALYRILNDDDDEIRRIGALAASAITVKLLAPWAACGKLVKIVEKTYANSVLFGKNVVARMTRCHHGLIRGELDISIRRARDDIITSLIEDNSLFVEEKANLWVDEVREVTRWSKVFARLPTDVVEFKAESSPQSLLDALVFYTGETLDELAGIPDLFLSTLALEFSAAPMQL